MAIPLVVNYGPSLLFVISLSLTSFWIAFGLVFFSPRRLSRRSPGPSAP
jgi:hypothetical protein